MSFVKSIGEVFPAFFCLFCLVSVAGCSSAESGPTTYPVSGSVMMNGKPVEGAELIFVPSKAAGDVELKPVQATTDSQGAFEVFSFFANGKVRQRGMLAGDYVVTISKFEELVGTDALARRPRNNLPRKYASPRSSDLVASIQASDSNQLEFLLKGGSK